MSGLLGQIIGGLVAGKLGNGSRGRRGAGSTVVNGLLVALAVKAAQHYLNQRQQDRSFDPRERTKQGTADRQGGMGGVLGGLGGLLGGLGGAGALGALLEQLRSKGFEDQVDSWVRPGPNRLLEPQQLAKGLGEEAVDALVEETGMPRQALLSDLSKALPEAVDELTPEGREPGDADLDRVLGVA